jgi:DNA-binding CsgD family transcriptional regulator
MKGGEGEEGDQTTSQAQDIEVHIVLRETHLPAPGLEILTVRERQVVACLASGHSTKEVAFALGIADATVRVLLARAANKFGVHSRQELLVHPAVQPLRQEIGPR